MLKRKSVFDPVSEDPRERLKEAIMSSTSVGVINDTVMLRYSTNPLPEMPSANQLMRDCFDSAFLTEQLSEISGCSLDEVEQCTDRILEHLYSDHALSGIEDALRDLIPDPLGYEVELDKLHEHIEGIQDPMLKDVLVELYMKFDIDALKRQAWQLHNEGK